MHMVIYKNLLRAENDRSPPTILRTWLTNMSGSLHLVWVNKIDSKIETVNLAKVIHIGRETGNFVTAAGTTLTTNLTTLKTPTQSFGLHPVRPEDEDELYACMLRTQNTSAKMSPNNRRASLQMLSLNKDAFAGLHRSPSQVSANLDDEDTESDSDSNDTDETETDSANDYDTHPPSIATQSVSASASASASAAPQQPLAQAQFNRKHVIGDTSTVSISLPDPPPEPEPKPSYGDEVEETPPPDPAPAPQSKLSPQRLSLYDSFKGAHTHTSGSMVGRRVSAKNTNSSWKNFVKRGSAGKIDTHVAEAKHEASIKE